jgi:hypothetical protein
MGRIRKIEKHKEERDRSGKFRKKKKEKMEETKRRDFYICRGSHTRVFSIGRERPWAIALSTTHSYPTHMGTSPTTQQH